MTRIKQINTDFFRLKDAKTIGENHFLILLLWIYTDFFCSAEIEIREIRPIRVIRVLIRTCVLTVVLWRGIKGEV